MTAHPADWPGPAEPATFGRRLSAWAVDLAVLALLTATLVAADLWLLRDVLGRADVGRWYDTASWAGRAGVWAVAAAVAVLGYAGLAQAGSSRTLGKQLAGIRPVQVVRMPGGRARLVQLRIRDALLRQVAHVLDLPLLWGFLRPRWDPYGRTMADEIVATFVVVDRDERCFEHERYLDRRVYLDQGADVEPAWWLCRQPGEELWRGTAGR